MPSTSLCSASTLSSTSSCCCLAVLLPSLPCPGPALADTLASGLLSLCHGDLLGAAPAVAPHPDIHLIEPAAVAPVLLRVSSGASKMPIVLEAVWNGGLTVAADETLNEGVAPKHVCHSADVEAGQALAVAIS
jgi:hypothetical protein